MTQKGVEGGGRKKERQRERDIRDRDTERYMKRHTERYGEK